jgi:DNA-binding MarR family transcriptional regulator
LGVRKVVSEANPSPDMIALANALRRGSSAFARRMRALRGAHGLSASKVSVLGRLMRATGRLTATEVAELERLQPQSLTRIIADLEARGLIRRAPDAADRRRLMLEITPAGRDLLVEDAWRQNAWLARALEARLSSDEIALMAEAAELLSRLAEAD